jgi:hypothetical protein
MTFYAFDVETEAGSDEQIRALAKPYVKPAPPGLFDESSVKTGNLKDPAKIAAKIEEARQEHQQAVASYADDCAKGEAEHWKQVREAAALNPVTGRVLVIGVKSAGGAERFISGDEPDILSAWWSRWEKLTDSGARWLSCNGRDFDLPYICRRSWINGVSVPGSAYDGRYWHNSFIDVRQRWLLGQRYADCESSLNHIARVLGVGEKLPGDIGARFGQVWREDRELALSYLRRDLDLTLSIAKRIGVIRERAA